MEELHRKLAPVGTKATPLAQVSKFLKLVLGRGASEPEQNQASIGAPSAVLGISTAILVVEAFEKAFEFQIELIPSIAVHIVTAVSLATLTRVATSTIVASTGLVRRDGSDIGTLVYRFDRARRNLCLILVPVVVGAYLFALFFERPVPMSASSRPAIESSRPGDMSTSSRLGASGSSMPLVGEPVEDEPLHVEFLFQNRTAGHTVLDRVQVMVTKLVVVESISCQQNELDSSGGEAGRDSYPLLSIADYYLDVKVDDSGIAQVFEMSPPIKVASDETVVFSLFVRPILENTLTGDCPEKAIWSASLSFSALTFSGQVITSSTTHPISDRLAKAQDDRNVGSSELLVLASDLSQPRSAAEALGRLVEGGEEQEVLRPVLSSFLESGDDVLIRQALAIFCIMRQRVCHAT